MRRKKGIHFCLLSHWRSQRGMCSLLIPVSTSSALTCGRSQLIQQVFVECLISDPFFLLCLPPLPLSRPFPQAFSHPQGALILKTRQIRTTQKTRPQGYLPFFFPATTPSQPNVTLSSPCAMRIFSPPGPSSGHSCATSAVTGMREFMDRASLSGSLCTCLSYST